MPLKNRKSSIIKCSVANCKSFKITYTFIFFPSAWEMVAGGGGRSSMGTSSLGGEGGDLSNSAMGASSGIGDTELLSIADNFMGDTLPTLKNVEHLRTTGGQTATGAGTENPSVAVRVTPEFCSVRVW